MRIGDFEIKHKHSIPSDLDARSVATYKALKPYTMTSPEAIDGLCRSVEYAVKNRIPGDIIECGVWRGGSMMAIARTLLEMGDTSRHLYLFDTFAGMPDVTEKDGAAAAQWMKRPDTSKLAIPLETVQKNIARVAYPAERVHFIRGRVEETIPANAPEKLALLRLDTDWYESTMHELVHLYPRLSPGGVLIIDDYGYWEGARKATDEYFADKPILLHRIDYTARFVVKPGL